MNRQDVELTESCRPLLLQVTSQPQRLSDGVWNCSVPFWSAIRFHFLCNRHRECVGGEDEQGCPYTLCKDGGECILAVFVEDKSQEILQLYERQSFVSGSVSDFHSGLLHLSLYFCLSVFACLSVHLSVSFLYMLTWKYLVSFISTTRQT